MLSDSGLERVNTPYLIRGTLRLMMITRLDSELASANVGKCLSMQPASIIAPVGRIGVRRHASLIFAAAPRTRAA